MLPYQERVVAERSELDEKLAVLHEFIAGPQFAMLEPGEQARLSEQKHAMADYSRILGTRIANFKEA